MFILNYFLRNSDILKVYERNSSIALLVERSLIVRKAPGSIPGDRLIPKTV